MAVRKIKNSCREYMTNNQSQIGFFKQLLFFFRYHLVDQYKLLYIGGNSEHKSIAYGLISYDSHLSPWLSGGILPNFRGKGYGRELFKYLSGEWNMPVYLEVLESNRRAHCLYLDLGFQEIERSERQIAKNKESVHIETVITMRKGE